MEGRQHRAGLSSYALQEKVRLGLRQHWSSRLSRPDVCEGTLSVSVSVRVRPCHVCDNLETCARKRGDRCIGVVVVGQRSQKIRSALELHVKLQLLDYAAGGARDVSTRYGPDR